MGSPDEPAAAPAPLAADAGLEKAVRHRATLRDKAAALVVVRAGLARAKVDPQRIKSLWTFEQAAEELSRLADSPDLRRAEAAFAAEHLAASGGESFPQQAARRAPAFAGRPAPAPGASLLDWYAWSLATAEPSAHEPDPTGPRGGN